MRFAAISAIGVLLSCVCTGFANDELVSRVIREATDHHERGLYNATIGGAQSTVKSGGRTKSSPLTEEIGRISAIYKHALDILVDKHEMDRTLALSALTRQLPAACQQPQINCQASSRYRTQDGTCNNLRNPLWGAVNQPYTRVAPSAYEDRFDAPRGGRQSRLPNPRVISVTIHEDMNVQYQQITNMVPQFGQFLDHDITRTPEANQRCCTGATDQNCWPISVPTNDPFFSRVSRPQTCIDFTRSTPYCFPTNSGVREQMNMNTAYIDASQVYGSDAARTRQIRQLSGGILKTNAQLNGFLPTTAAVNPSLTSIGTFIAGDDRINENPALASLHNLFLKEHNRLANEIRNYRPGFNDETIFQEARRILAAQLQQITYNEYLPIVMGDAAMREYNLYLGSSYTNYDPTMDATIFNSFAAAAYRFGHSLVSGIMRLVRNRGVIGSFALRDNFAQSGQVTQSNGQGYDWILAGLMTQNSQEFDRYMSSDLTNFLFRQPNNDFGSDLAARNIQRGRDHGLSPYNTYRNLCGLTTLTTWGFRPAEINSIAWSRLQSLYTTPNDIDLFTGGLVENPVAGGLSGTTFNCLKGVQFARAKFGDRFFFTHGNQAGSFTPAQITQLRARTLGDIICESGNTQQTETPRNVFLVPGPNNPWVSCNDPSRNRLNIATFV